MSRLSLSQSIRPPSTKDYTVRLDIGDYAALSDCQASALHLHYRAITAKTSCFITATGLSHHGLHRQSSTNSEQIAIVGSRYAM